MTSTPSTKLPIVVLLSGRGSNFQAIERAIANGSVVAEIRAVISNRPDTAGLVIAQAAGIPTAVVDHTRYDNRDAYDTALQEAIDQYAPALVVLAGFMRILTPAFVRHFQGRLINIHPSLLPKYRGLHTHTRALEAGDSEHGASVHYVTEELDGGPVFLQARVPVLSGDTPESLARRVLEQEHVLYPAAVRMIAEGRVEWCSDGIHLDGTLLEQPVILNGNIA